MKRQQNINLLHTAGQLFKKYGVKALTMDDLARKMNISKKTIYLYVEDKRDLVKQSMVLYIEGERNQIENIIRSSDNAADEMIRMIAYFYSQVREFTSATLVDIQTYYPESWEIFSKHRYHFMQERIRENLEKGVRQGMYREELDTETIAKLYIGIIDVLSNQELFPAKGYVFFNIYKEFINYHMRGIVSAKGLQYLVEHDFFNKEWLQTEIG